MTDSLPEVFERVCNVRPELAVPGFCWDSYSWWLHSDSIEDHIAEAIIRDACWRVLPQHYYWLDEDYGMYYINKFVDLQERGVCTDASLTLALLLAVEQQP